MGDFANQGEMGVGSPYPSAIPCPKCGSQNTYIWNQQVTSESRGVMAIGQIPKSRCRECGHVGNVVITRQKGRPGPRPS